jgi:intracellular septation protein A
VFLPPIVFYAVEKRKGYANASIVACLMAVLTLVWMVFRYGAEVVDALVVLELGLLAVLTFVGIKLQNSKAFKLQPAIINLAGALYLLLFQAMGQPVFVKYKPMILKMSPNPEEVDRLLTVQLLSGISLNIGVFLLVYALSMYVVATRFSTGFWLAGRLAHLPLALVVMILSVRP